MKRPGSPAMRSWRVERVSDTSRELVAVGKAPANQDHDDTAIAIATKVGRIIKRDMATAQAVGWIDVRSATAQRYESRYEVGFEWAEMRTAIYDTLYVGQTTVLIHRGENLTLTIDPERQCQP